jgi:hypothetical protein
MCTDVVLLQVLVEERNVKQPEQVKGRIDQGRPVYLEVAVVVIGGSSSSNRR